MIIEGHEEQKAACLPIPPRGLKLRQMARWIRSVPGVQYHEHEDFPYMCVAAELTVVVYGHSPRTLKGNGFAKCAPVDYPKYTPARGYKIARGRAELGLAMSILWEQGPGPSLQQKLTDISLELDRRSIKYLDKVIAVIRENGGIK